MQNNKTKKEEYKIAYIVANVHLIRFTIYPMYKFMLHKKAMLSHHKCFEYHVCLLL